MARTYEFGYVWEFRTDRFVVTLLLEWDRSYKYDGDDPDGEIQGLLRSGAMVAFDATLTVQMDGIEVGRDTLGGNVYEMGKVAEFYTAHRDPDPANRNSTANPRGYSIGHYFPDMVREAIRQARAEVARLHKQWAELPRVREG